MQPDLRAVNKQYFLNVLFSRFFAVFFLILILPFPVTYLPLPGILKNSYPNLLNALIIWTGHHVFHIVIPLAPSRNGSGDTVFSYLRLFVVLIIAVVITVIWSVTDRKQKTDAFISYLLMVYMRFFFALIMMRYGIEKVIKAQFPFPYYSLTETYGESSPMRLMWSFMGYSTTYNFFMGCIEITSGFLVLFRKTTTLGALLGVAILCNIVVLNFCFDVPVKTFALTFLSVAFYILYPDLTRLYYFFFLNKAVPEVSFAPRFRKQQMNAFWNILKFALAVSILYAITGVIRLKYTMYGDGAFKKTPLFGIYHVETFVKNGDTLLPLLTDASQWKTANIIFTKKATIKMMNDSSRICRFVTDTLHKTIHVNDTEDSTYTAFFRYSLPDSSHLFLTGKIQEDSVSVLMKKQDMNQYRLLNRGFHWINESPYNR